MNENETKAVRSAREAMHPANNVPYLVATVAMIMVAIIAIVLVAVLRPGEDNMALYVLILGSIGPTTLALLSLMKSQETHLSVNSRLDQFIQNADRSARAEGELVGRAAGRDVANDRTDALKVERDHRADVVSGQVKSHESKPAVSEPSTDNKAHLEIEATLTSPEGSEKISVEDIEASIRPGEEQPKKTGPTRIPRSR